MDALLLTKTSKAGATIEVYGIDADAECGYRAYRVLIDGKQAGKDEWAITKLSPHLQRQLPGYTHMHESAKVAFAAEEAATITASREAAFAASAAAQSAANPMAGLRAERRKLAIAVSAALDAERAVSNRYMDSGDAADYRSSKRERAELATAQQALADFDAAHPEVAAEIAAERKARVEAFLARD